MGGGGGGGGTGGSNRPTSNGGDGGALGLIEIARRCNLDEAEAITHQLNQLEEQVHSDLPNGTILGWKRDILIDDQARPENVPGYIQGIDFLGPQDSGQLKGVQAIVTGALTGLPSQGSGVVKGIKLLAGHGGHTALLSIQVLKPGRSDFSALGYVAVLAQIDTNPERAAKVEQQLIDYGTRGSVDPDAYHQSVEKVLHDIRSS